MNAQEGQVLNLHSGVFAFSGSAWGDGLRSPLPPPLRLFDPDNYAQNYGIVFTAYGVGALLGTLATGSIRDWFGTYTYAFYPMAGIGRYRHYYC